MEVDFQRGMPSRALSRMRQHGSRIFSDRAGVGYLPIPTADAHIGVGLTSTDVAPESHKSPRRKKRDPVPWMDGPRFQSFIGAAIITNALLLGMETDIAWDGWLYIEQAFLVIYLFEISMRMMRVGGRFFFACSNPDVGWNLLDFTIVMSSVMDSWVIPLTQYAATVMQGKDGHAGKKLADAMHLGNLVLLMRTLRLMRILRLVRLVKSVKPLYILVTCVLTTLQGVFWVLVLCLVTLYAMGILATRLIGHKLLFPPGVEVPPEVLEPWLTVPDSMFILFRVMSDSSSIKEAFALDELMQALPTVKFAFVFFMITSSWTLLSILTAVVSENMISVTGQQEAELRIARFEEERAETIRLLKELFACIDTNQDQQVDHDEVSTFIERDENANEMARLCRIPRRDLLQVLSFISSEDEPVDLGRFVECLVDVAAPVTQKSMLLLEGKLAQVIRSQTAVLQSLKEWVKPLHLLQEQRAASEERPWHRPDRLAEVAERSPACEDAWAEVSTRRELVFDDPAACGAAAAAAAAARERELRAARAGAGGEAKGWSKESAARSVDGVRNDDSKGWSKTTDMSRDGSKRWAGESPGKASDPLEQSKARSPFFVGGQRQGGLAASCLPTCLPTRYPTSGTPQRARGDLAASPMDLAASTLKALTASALKEVTATAMQEVAATAMREASVLKEVTATAVREALRKHEVFAEKMEAALDRLVSQELKVSEAMASLQEALAEVARGQAQLLEKQAASEWWRQESWGTLLASLRSSLAADGVRPDTVRQPGEERRLAG